ncbi:MAG: hypothetical protein A3D44_03625 [Candidatus Staskawiczbacteria bacterium RIFCSPHIGHO2_02_FULL_42_22]|uniref:Uncharacterized protein n=1 Tax=Candidatus Staskawiczbacteria bacterium RIFCSPHIGHO2_02_FULL_42_22 TaxID=1802207 RepID=A0A1G2I4R7_9BACT|nr:MAG: hypothetical protein A3D44_03625 [Candidatus Staskawiczbacteria bacterium RIFCSPHIGHO2_02_FULL_42_22]
MGRASRGRPTRRSKIKKFYSGVHLQRGSNPFYGERVKNAARLRARGTTNERQPHGQAKIFSPRPEFLRACQKTFCDFMFFMIVSR